MAKRPSRQFGPPPREPLTGGLQFAPKPAPAAPASPAAPAVPSPRQFQAPRAPAPADDAVRQAHDGQAQQPSTPQTLPEAA